MFNLFAPSDIKKKTKCSPQNSSVTEKEKLKRLHSNGRIDTTVKTCYIILVLKKKLLSSPRFKHVTTILGTFIPTFFSFLFHKFSIDDRSYILIFYTNNY